MSPGYLGFERMIEKPSLERFKGGSSDSIDTSFSRYYQRALKITLKHISSELLKKPSIDPFARDCQWAKITNDLDPSKKAKYNMDALDFVSMFDSESISMVLFDPPFSTSQEKKYEYNSNLYASDSNKISKLYKECFRVLAPGGMMLKLGYNSTRPHPGFKLKHLMVVNFGGSRNDVIASIWRKEQTTLTQYTIKELKE